MNQLKGLWRDTWWLWTLFLISVTIMTVWVTRIYVVGYPMLLVMMFYFAFMRYDETGKYIHDD